MEITAYILFSKTIVFSHREYIVVWPVCDSYSANGMSYPSMYYTSMFVADTEDILEDWSLCGLWSSTSRLKVRTSSLWPVLVWAKATPRPLYLSLPLSPRLSHTT